MEFIIDAHCHTLASGHAYSTVNEIAQAAATRGLALVAITDHAPNMPGSCGLFHFMNLIVLPETLHGVRLCSGAELNIMDEDGTVDLPESVLKKLDVVIASLHPPCFEPREEKRVTAALINTMENPHVRVIGHPGDPRYPFDIDAVADAAVRTGTLLEINNSSLSAKSLRGGNAGMIENIARACLARDWPVILGSDAHFMDDVGRVDEAAALAQRAGLPGELIVNTSLELFRQYILQK